MWDRDFLDKWDMARRIEARLFCFGSGDSDDSSSDSGGSDPAPDDTQANYEQEAFGGPRNQTDGVNFRQAPAQPVSDSDPADRIANVVGLDLGHHVGEVECDRLIHGALGAGRCARGKLRRKRRHL